MLFRSTRWIAIRSSIGWRLVRGLAGMGLLLLMTSRVLAHDVPNDVLLRSFLHPSGETLQVLMRVPMRALRDIDHPRRPGGWLDLARADPSLRDAAKAGRDVASTTLNAFAEHAANSGSAVGRQVQASVDQLSGDLGRVAEAQIKSSIETGRATAALLARAASGFLAGIAEMIEQRPVKGKPPGDGTGGPAAPGA